MKIRDENYLPSDVSPDTEDTDNNEINVIEHRVYDRQGNLAGRAINFRDAFGDYGQDVPGINVPNGPRLRDLFNIHLLTTGWNAMVTACVMITGTVPSIAQRLSSIDVSDWSRGTLVGLGLVFTALSGFNWWSDINRKATAPVFARTSGGDEPSVRGP